MLSKHYLSKYFFSLGERLLEKYLAINNKRVPHEVLAM